MLSIMDNRKRTRLEMIQVENNNCNENMQQGVAATANNLGTATLATIGGQSYLLSNSATSSIPANILLSICDENSDETEEYILDHSILTPVKQEQTIATQTNNNQTQLQQTNLVNTTTSQYHIVDQTGKILSTSSLNPLMINSSELNANCLNNLNLPPGCEIYVIKEVFDNPKQIIAESTTTPTATCTSSKIRSANISGIRPEQFTKVPPVRRRLLPTNNSTQNLTSNSTITINNSPATSTSSATVTFPDETTKRSLILEAYKKRDDKRRAIHNEVERRRRDKINSWIFKLKEMLPSEQGTSNSTRTSSSDSKSQILIRACEYIKTMQEEMNSLRECLTENEHLRLKNERLQEEINSLRAGKQQQKLHNNNNNLLLRTNTTNNSNNSSHNSDNSDSCELTLNSLNTTYANVQLFTPSTQHHLVNLDGLTSSHGATSSSNLVNVKYPKRELIITDYVD